MNSKLPRFVLLTSKINRQHIQLVLSVLVPSLVGRFLCVDLTSCLARLLMAQPPFARYAGFDCGAYIQSGSHRRQRWIYADQPADGRTVGGR